MLQGEADARNGQLNESVSSVVRRGHVHGVACASSCGVCVFVWRVRLVCVYVEFARLQMFAELNNVKRVFFYFYFYFFFFFFFYFFFIFFLCFSFCGSI